MKTKLWFKLSCWVMLVVSMVVDSIDKANFMKHIVGPTMLGLFQLAL